MRRRSATRWPRRAVTMFRMARYLQARTSFFDRVVMNGLERDVAQVACIGAGYDGRSLRYAKPGVRWFEVDHPATQADKRGRLERLNVDISHTTFVALDLDDGGVDSALVERGFDPDAPSLMLCEGLAVNLDRTVLATLLKDLRTLVTAGTRLAISLLLPAADAGQLARRERFRTAVAALGEPAPSQVPADEAAEMVAAARWRAVEISERSRDAGFSVMVPVWELATAEVPATRSRVGGYLERLYHRRGTESLPRHLRDAYGIDVDGIRQLDAGVFRVDRRDGTAVGCPHLPRGSGIRGQPGRCGDPQVP
jgi:methyltransferase (TIGR00027 family)